MSDLQQATGTMQEETRHELSLDTAREVLAGKTGKRYWRSLEELAEKPGFHEMLAREFPRQASEWVDSVSRRGFLKLAGASLAMAGLAGCTKQPDEPIYPYVKQPEDLVLGKPMYFATAYPFPSGAIPLLVKSDAFRPIKIDGNPEHPLYKDGVNPWGPSDAFAQATLLDLYDPDRAQHVTYRGEVRQWGDFQIALQKALAAKGGDGVAVLTATVTSPTLAAQIKQAQQKHPGIRFVQYEPVNQDSSRAASKAAFGQYTDAQYKLDAADVILSLDADFLSGAQFPGFLKLASDYAKRRKRPDEDLSRLYVVESMPTTTGFKAEHRLALRASEIEAFANGLNDHDSGYPWTPEQRKFAEALYKDLHGHAGKCVVIPGEHASVGTHLAAYALNQQLGNVGKTVVYTETVNPMPSEQTDDLKQLVADMNAGKIEFLVMLGVNPVYSTPGDLKFEEAAKNVKVLAQLSQHVDETGQISHWTINQAHYLEHWSDARAYDGTLSIIQPMIDPLYAGVSGHDVVQTMLDDPALSAYDAVRANWKMSDAAWRKALHAGFVENTAFTPKGGGAGGAKAAPAANPDPNAIEIIFRPDPTLYDGRFANVGWLQELPKPVTNLSWDNAALMSSRLAEKLGVAENDLIEITLDGRKAAAPVLRVPGHPLNSITLHLGSGRAFAGRVGSGQGHDVYPLRGSDAPLFATGATVKKTGEVYEVAVTKSHYTDNRGTWAFNYGEPDAEKHPNPGNISMEGKEAAERAIIRYATLEEYKKTPGFAHEGEGKEPQRLDTSMFPNYSYDKNAWGMSIDMNSCVGCNACIVSCYAENNIPVVGKHQVKIGRNMQWLRIDTYFEGDLDTPKAHLQPMACQHCENAPCEQVCPVGATVHTPEGLNQMVYNRCVGTRYCSNNCPYKVRRFNFLLFSDYETESLKLMRNPDVSVRSRGVMEKCTYCVQRINAAKFEADKENRQVRDGEIVTACQQACPTNAITFGNINDKNSRVAKLKSDERSYKVLEDNNTRPRTTYVAGVVNPNPVLEGAEG